MIIAPSILAADFGHLQDEVASIEPYCEWLQLDVMDGHFVPNLSFGAPVGKCIKTKLLLDAHLMVTNPADRITEFAAIGCGNITFHAEVVQATKDRRARDLGDGLPGAMGGLRPAQDRFASRRIESFLPGYFRPMTPFLTLRP